MARERSSEEAALAAQKNQIKNEKKQLKLEQKQQKKEAKRRAKEISKKEEALDDDSDGGGLATFFATILIVAVWLAVIVVIIKLDIGGFGSNVLAPVLGDVPIINRILPRDSITETTDTESYGGYSSLQDAVNQIRLLEGELERSQANVTQLNADIVDLQAEVLRLQEFEKMMTEFQRIRTQFYEEVVYAENGPGVEEYVRYYEAMDPTNAEYIYRQVIAQLQESEEVRSYASAYSLMKPAQAAAIFEEMTDNLNLVARILRVMGADSRGAILGNMDPEIAARLTKIMDPES